MSAGDRYLALAMLAERWEAGTALPLAASEMKVFSQNGEDGILQSILARTGTGEGSFTEIGAGEGLEANCVFLADVLGWTGTMVEGDPSVYERLAAKYEGSARVRTVNLRVTEDGVDALVRGEPDVLSIDVDGADWWLWRAVRSTRPRVVVVEYNGALGFERALTVPADAGPWDATAYFGASLPALEMLAEAKGYRLVHTDLTGVNAFFVRSDLDQGFLPPDQVPRRAPNYLMQGLRHAPAKRGKDWVEVTPELAAG